MKLQILSVYDAKARAYMAPFFASHIDVGIRNFKGAANTKGTPIGDHPEDFTLYHIGEFDDETSVITTQDRKAIAQASSLVKQGA